MKKINKTNKLLEKCVLCPHMCHANRISGEVGFCSAGSTATVSSVMPHHGEEPPISGTRGSGTIFFSHCNMKCVYCQNYQISQEHSGKAFSIEQLAIEMLSLEQQECHNINLVSPTIWIPQIIEALSIAKKSGLNIPIVYNTGGYEREQIIKLLDGIINIYMPDIRYSSDIMAERYSGVKNYVNNNRKSIKEMYRQVGELDLDDNGIAKKGLLIRLLVLPENIGSVKETLDFIKEELSEYVYLSIMAQYHPEYMALNYPGLSRSILPDEYYEIVDYAEKLGLANGWTQDYCAPEKDLFRPDFNRKKVFKYYEEN
jgi:putative pyruvate formate lyase activating enzyme